MILTLLVTSSFYSSFLVAGFYSLTVASSDVDTSSLLSGENIIA